MVYLKYTRFVAGQWTLDNWLVVWGAQTKRHWAQTGRYRWPYPEHRHRVDMEQLLGEQTGGLPPASAALAGDDLLPYVFAPVILATCLAQYRAGIQG